MRKAKFSLISILLLLLTGGVVLAEGNGYDIGRWLTSSGGGTRGSEHYVVQDVTGQAAAGASQSENFLLYAGFLTTTSSAPVPPTVALSTATYSVGEGDGNATITVNLSAASAETVTVGYATSDGTATAPDDYTAASGTLTFNSSETSKTFSVSIVDDAVVEIDEAVYLSLSNPSNATLGEPSTAVLTIVDDESGCFIATAAYGTPIAEEIQILREFRDEYLLTNPVGQALVDIYYSVSTPIAKFITEHPSLKPIVRTGLVPAVAMSTVAVNTSAAEKMAIVGLLVLVSVAVAIWATRRRGKVPKYI